MAEVFLHATSADEFAGMRRAIEALANEVSALKVFDEDYGFRVELHGG